MTLLIAKVICWNSNGYTGPSGDNAVKGFKNKSGYGHEEWNNSPKLQFEKDGIKYRAFHTETVGKELVHENVGDIIICMYARKGNSQYLLGIAAEATCLIDKDNEREELAKQLKINTLGDDAWGTQSIKDLWENDKKSWKNHWYEWSNWIPNWYCPVDKFIWFDNPIEIDVTKVTGKQLLNNNYGTHQPLSPEQVKTIIGSVPKNLQTERWKSIFNIAVTESDHSAAKTLIDDINEITRNRELTETQRKSLIDTRLGQGKFRAALDFRWNNKCAVTDISTRELLRASHIKPWKDSNNSEKLDPNNGLLLSANIDALFDKGLITFNNNGEMILSTDLEESTTSKMKLPQKLRKTLEPSEKQYLEHHRNEIFKG